jgi:hypothetical protein
VFSSCNGSALELKANGSALEYPTICSLDGVWQRNRLGSGSAFDNGSVLRVRDNGTVSWSSGRPCSSSGSAEANGSALECVLDTIESIQVVCFFAQRKRVILEVDPLNLGQD